MIYKKSFIPEACLINPVRSLFIQLTLWKNLSTKFRSKKIDFLAMKIANWHGVKKQE